MVLVFIKGPSMNNNKDQTLRRMKISAIVLVVIWIYIFIGAAIFLALDPEYGSAGVCSNNGTQSTYLDSVYFTVITITTVGYGNIVPLEDSSKLFLSFYILLSLVLVGLLLDVTDFLFELPDVDADGDGVLTEEEEREGKKERTRRLLWAMVSFLIIVLVGILFFLLVEGLSLVDSIYLSVVTLSTVGYGDFYPSTQTGKYFAVFWISIGCLTLFRAIGTFMAVVMEERKALWRSRHRIRQVELRDQIGSVMKDAMVDLPASEILRNYSKLELLTVLTKVEYMLFRLEADKLVSAEQLRKLNLEYSTLDKVKIEEQLKSKTTAFSIENTV